MEDLGLIYATHTSNLLFRYFNQKRVLVTGHTGFKGSWLSLWLHKLGAEVTGLALDPKTEQDAFHAMHIPDICEDLRVDVRNYDQVLNTFKNYQPEIVFHLAAQPLVLESYERPLYTYETNVMGTANILEAARHTDSVRNILLITTDKVYENKEMVWGYRENDPLGGFEPYGTSKAAAELVIAGYRHSFFHPSKFQTHQTTVASVRAGNVIGGGDWAENRIIPDCIRALKANQPIEVRQPQAIRPWQHVLEALGGYLLLTVKMAKDPKKYCDAWNFGPGLEGIKNVEAVVRQVIASWGSGQWQVNTPQQAKYESKILALDISKARLKLDWTPALSFQEAIGQTVDWYRAQNQKKDMKEFSLEQIRTFEKKMSVKLPTSAQPPE